MTTTTPVAGADSPVPIEALVGAPLQFMVDRWDSLEPSPGDHHDLAPRAPAMLRALQDFLVDDTAVDKLQAGIAGGDDRAFGALSKLEAAMTGIYEVLIKRCKDLGRDGDWRELGHEALLAAHLAAGTGRHHECAVALRLVAMAHRGDGDVKGTIAAYRDAIVEARQAHDEVELAVDYDNMGNALADSGQYDDAADAFDESLRHERDLQSIGIILSNKANAQTAVGEFRSAAEQHRLRIQQLEKAGVAGRQLAVALDNAARAVAGLGEPGDALAMLDRARTLFPPEDLQGLIVNAFSRANALGTLSRHAESATAYSEAHDLAFDYARHSLRPEHYREGYLEARAHALPNGDEARALLLMGIAAKARNAWGEALQYLERAGRRARDMGDHALALRVDANAAAVLAEAGQAKRARDLADRVSREAAERGLARPELMATGTLASLALAGVELEDARPAILLLARSAVLLEVHSRIVAETKLDEAITQFESYDTGTIANELALQAARYHADELAIAHARDAIAKARALGMPFELANRLAGLRTALSRSHKEQEAEQVAGELASLLAAGNLPLRGQLVAHRELSFHLEQRDAQQAIDHARRACEASEALRRRVAPGAERADVTREWSGLYRHLARLLRQAGEETPSFEALQGDKGRRLMDALAARADAPNDAADAPATASEVVSLVDRLGADPATTLVDLFVEEDGVTAYLVGQGSVRCLHVAGDPSHFAEASHGDVHEREARVVELCGRDPSLTQLAGAIAAAVPRDNRLLIAPDQFLRNLPLHIVPVEGAPWCDHSAISYVEGAGTLRFAPSKQAPTGRSLVAGDSRGDLFYAASECLEVAEVLGADPLLGPKCTRAAIEEVLGAGELDVVHLALHGRADMRRGGRASLLLADGEGGTEWVPFEQLTRIPWKARLVVFSGCSTAAAAPLYGNALVSVAEAAAEAGAAAVLGCLWPVRDDAAELFMKTFYGEVLRQHNSPSSDLRVAMDTARNAVRAAKLSASPNGVRRRDGRTRVMDTATMDPALADTLGWAPFVLFGSPVIWA